MNPEQQPQTLEVKYDDVADVVFERLVDLGYAPESDEVLDVSDIVFEILISILSATGVGIVFMSELEDGDIDG